MKGVTVNSSLIYGTNLNNLNRRSRVHQIPVGLLFPVWYLISLKDHSPKAYTAKKLKAGGGEKRNRLVKNRDFFVTLQIFARSSIEISTVDYNL